MGIVDRRKNGKNKSAENRRRFMDKYKKKIKESVDTAAEKRNIKDVMDKGEVTVSGGDIDEPNFRYNRDSGEYDIILPGNTEYEKGDILNKPPNSGGAGGSAGSDSGEGEDDFTFTLTKEEFLEIYFNDLELPNLDKDSIAQAIKYKYKKTGYSKEGVPARLNIKKTMESAIMRRIANKEEGKKPRYLDDVDIRYDFYTKQPEPILKATMFCILDVSGSMSKMHKTIAKKFFLLLYLFLHTKYNEVELVFIRHTHEAKEVDEEEFFYYRTSGGTIISTAYTLMNKIIEDRIDLNSTNVYLAQASDGDNWEKDIEKAVQDLEHIILPQVQYGAYIQINNEEAASWKAEYGITDMYDHLTPVAERVKKFNMRTIHKIADVYEVLRDLFKKEGAA